ncbi:hypothetical protein Tco_1145448 [Tanacetum coccineum]
MPPISSYLTIEESAEEHDIGDEYLTKGYLTEKEQQQLALDEEALRETLEEEARAEKERERDEKEWEEEMKKQQAHDELFRTICVFAFQVDFYQPAVGVAIANDQEGLFERLFGQKICARKRAEFLALNLNLIRTSESESESAAEMSESE